VPVRRAVKPGDDDAVLLGPERIAGHGEILERTFD
jgi:hypothetical protein